MGPLRSAVQTSRITDAASGHDAGRWRWLTCPLLACLVRDRLLAAVCALLPLAYLALAALGLPLAPCSFRALTGLPCPGCGLTRAATCLVHGRWAAAMRLHPFAPLFVLGWSVVVVCGLLPARPRAAAAGWLERFERRTGFAVITLLAAAAFGLVRLAVEAATAFS